MKRFLLAVVLLSLPVWLAGCGYQNPYLVEKRKMAALEEGAQPVSLHAEMWENRTSELGLQLVFQNEVSNWFQNSERIRLTRTREGAEYLLTGRIIAIDEGLTRGTVRLTVEYAFVRQPEGEKVWQVPGQTFSESFFISNNAAQTQDNKRRALEKIADDLAESIYMRVLHSLRKRE